MFSHHMKDWVESAMANVEAIEKNINDGSFLKNYRNTDEIRGGSVKTDIKVGMDEHGAI